MMESKLSETDKVYYGLCENCEWLPRKSIPEWQNFNSFNGLLSVHMVNIKIILGVN